MQLRRESIGTPPPIRLATTRSTLRNDDGHSTSSIESSDILRSEVCLFNRISSGESAALGYFSVSIFFGQVDNKESKNKYSSIAV